MKRFFWRLIAAVAIGMCPACEADEQPEPAHISPAHYCPEFDGLPDPTKPAPMEDEE